jgi:hypothetical protein
LEGFKQRYAFGRWASLWPSEPYMSHRIVLDRETRTVVAAQDRRFRCWTSMHEDDRAYMQQIFDETYSHAFEDPVAFALTLADTMPEWATAAWDWPPLKDPFADEPVIERIMEPMIVKRGRREKLVLSPVLRLRYPTDAERE